MSEKANERWVISRVAFPFRRANISTSTDSWTALPQPPALSVGEQLAKLSKPSEKNHCHSRHTAYGRIRNEAGGKRARDKGSARQAGIADGRGDWI